jgi:LEA14-like dessication related protein
MKKTHTKKAIIYCRILFLVAFCVFLVSCLSWVMEMPSFTLRGVTLRPISFTRMNLLLDLDVRNPNSFDLTFKSFEYTVSLGGEEIGNGHMEKVLLIPSSATTRIQAPVAAGFKDLSGSLKAVLTQEDLPYKIEGKVIVKTVFGSRQFPFSNEGRINLKN